MDQVLTWCRRENLAEYRRVTVFTGENASRFSDLARSPGREIFDRWYVLDNRLLSDDIYDQCWQQVRRQQLMWSLFEGGRFDWPKSQLDGFFQYAPASKKQVAVVDVRHIPQIAQRKEWLFLRDWYCQRMHKSADGNFAAWWSVLDESADAQKLLEPFSLDCGGVKVQVLDLLMIGSKNGSDIDWHAAALSNLSSDRTECTIRVVTGKKALRELEESVRGFCNNFRAPSNNDNVPGVEAFGKWEEWPNAEWKKP